ncbi:cytochrome P450 6B7 isoform X1 [Bemisia tabaci]
MMDFSESLSSLSPLLCVPLFVGSLCLALNYLVYSRRVAEWRKSKIPFLEPSFLIGHKYFWSVGSNSAVVPIDRIYRENKDKDLVAFFIATMPVVLVRSPALIKQLFVKNFDKTFETGWAASQKDKIAQHMLNLCTDKGVWKSGRNALSPMFTTARVSGEHFAKIRNQIANMWTHAEEARLQGKPINTKQVAMNFIQDGTSNSFFGLGANSYEKKGELLKLVESFAEPGWNRLLSAFAQMHLQGVQGFESLKFITQNHIESMKSMLQKQTAQRGQTGSNENDFIDILINLKEQDQGKKEDSEMDVTNEMIGLGLSLLLGRTESTAILASFTMHLLSLHPEYQERIRQEVDEAMRKHNTTEFTYEVVRDLHFLDQCLHETARLYPNTSALTRVCTEDVTLAGTDLTLKKGERIIVDAYSVHRDPEHFQNPDVFDPDRFSPKNRDKKAIDAFLGFGTGPRKCPGYKVGFLMASTLIGSLVHKYEVRPRSHTKQMDAYDFHPRSFVNVHKDDILVDVMPREILAC